MIVTNGLDISGKDYFGRREDLSFIVRFQWKTSNHLKEAIQVLLASRLDDGIVSHMARTAKKRSEVLDDSEFEQIRMQIASNPNTPPQVLEYLSRTSSVRVLERVAENPRTAPDVLQRLAVCANAAVRAAVVENVNTPAEVLKTFASDPDADVRYRVAENPHVDEDVLNVLANDTNPYVSSRAMATLGKVVGGMVVTGEFHERVSRAPLNNQSVSAK